MNHSEATSKGECPVCFQIPRANIYQCANGHSICDLCSTKITVCPTCRSPGVRIRNRLAESLLDGIKFECSWNSHGCKETMLRGELSAHEKGCDKNPDLMKVCSILFGGETCHYKITPKWLTKPENCTDFINHITTCHGGRITNKIQMGKIYKTSMEWSVVQSIGSSSFKSVKQTIPMFYRFQNPNNGKEEIFFRVCLLKPYMFYNTYISWVFVRLTPEMMPVVMKNTIPEGIKSGMVDQWGANSSPVLSWTLKPISLSQFMNMLKTPQGSDEMDTSFPFSLPVSFLSKYYMGDDGKLNDTVTFEITS